MTIDLVDDQPLRAEVYLARAPSHNLWPAGSSVRPALGCHEHVVRLGVIGELDVATAPVLRDAVVAAGRSHRIHSAWARDPAVELDLSGLSFVDSRGVTALADAQQTLAGLGCRLCLTHPQRPVLWLLEFAVASGWLSAGTECVTEHPWPTLTDAIPDQAHGPGRGSAWRLARVRAARTETAATATVSGPDSAPWDAA